MTEDKKEGEGVEVMVFQEANKMAAENLDIYMAVDLKDIEFTGKKLGEGGFGVVYEARYKGMPVAVKQILPKYADAKEERDLMLNEISIMARLRHANICEYFGYVNEPLSIITRWYPSNLFDLIDSGRLTREDCFRITYQVVSAVYYMHSRRLLHRDLKPDNIFIDEDGNAKIGDFGLTVMMTGEKVIDATNPPGSEWFMAPELLQHKPFDQSCEVYSLGLIIFGLFTGEFPLDAAETVPDLIELQKQTPLLPYNEGYYSTRPGDGKPPKELFEYISEKCCAYDPAKRPSSGEVLDKIVELGTKAVIFKSNSTADHWIKMAKKTYRTHVLLTEFIDNMSKTIVPTKPVDVTLTQATPASWKLMEIEHFWDICCWFPNFFTSKDAYSLMEKTVYAPWYCRDEIEASARLQAVGRETTNVFVICPSTENPFFNPFVVRAMVNGVRKDKYVSRRQLPGERAPVLMCPFTGEQHHSALKVLVLVLVRDLKFLIAPILE